MARKNVLNSVIALNQSLVTSFTSTPTVIKYLDNCSYQIHVVTASSSGTFSVQGSNDYTVSEPNNQVSNQGFWVDLPLSGTPNVSGASDEILIDLRQLPFNAIRVAYTSTTAGAGVCTITLNSKQVGG